MSNFSKLSHHIQNAIKFENAYPYGYHHVAKGAIINPYVVHWDTVVWTWIGMGLLILAAFIIRKNLSLIPKPFSLQNIVEWIWDFHEGIAKEMLGEEAYQYMSVIMTIFFFVLMGNLFGLIPLFNPYTRDANTTVGLAIYSFCAFTYYGLKKKGIVNWIKHFMHPIPELAHSLDGALKYLMIPLLFPFFIFLNIVEETVRIVSLSMRLFGNIMGKHIVIAVLLGLAAYITLIFDPLPIFVWLIGLIASIVQALIFSLLTLAYIAGAVAELH